MSREQQKPRSPVPADYSRLRIPREEVLRRFAEGDRLRRDGGRDAGGGSIYDERGLVEV